MPSRRVLLAFAFASFAAACALAGGSCKRTGTGTSGSGGGTGGEGGCPIAPEPMFTITVRAVEGPVPPDMSLRVTWSAGEEPLFVLSDPSTWKTLDQANLVCDIDQTAPPPSDLQALVCQLWTSGATRVEIAAQGYVPYDETLSPMESELCEGFVPSDVEIKIARDMDAGTE